MTYDQFYKSCKGKLIDYDSVSGAQCVDLAKVYLNSCFGIKPGAWGNAVDYFTSFEKRKLIHWSISKRITLDEVLI